MNDAVRNALLKEVPDRFDEYIRHRRQKRRWTGVILLQARDPAKYRRGESQSYKGFYFRW